MPNDAGRERRALIAGASGLVGGHCLELLLASSRYAEVCSIGRRRLAREHTRLRQAVVDFDRVEAAVGSLLADDVFCCLGTTIRRAGSQAAFRRVDLEYPLRLAQAMRRRGATQFLVVSSLGAHPRARAFYLRVKGELEEALRGVGFERLVILRPSLLLGARTESRPGEAVAKLAMKGLSALLLGRLRRYRPVEALAVARTLIREAAAGGSGVQVIESEDIPRA